MQIQEHFNEWSAYEIFESERYQHFLDLPKELIAEGYSILVAVGGDGTLHEVINGIGRAFETSAGEISDELSKVKVGLLPCGTGNDFARSINVSDDVARLAQMIKNGQSKLINFGHVSLVDTNQKPTDAYFINILDAGMGGVITKRMNDRGFSGSYKLNVLRTFVTYKPLSIQCKSDDFEWQGKVISLVFANGKYYADGVGIAPHADVEADEMAITACGELGMFTYLTKLPELKKCKKIAHPQISYAQGKKINILASDVSVPIEADGEFLGYTPASAKLLKGKLNFIC